MTPKSLARLQRQQYALKELTRAKHKRKRQALMKMGGDDLTQCLCECVLNVIKGNVSLTKTQFKKLKRFKTPLRQLVNKKTSLRKKKTIIEQKGGRLLPNIITPIIKALGGSVLGIG